MIMAECHISSFVALVLNTLIMMLKLLKCAYDHVICGISHEKLKQENNEYIPVFVFSCQQKCERSYSYLNPVVKSHNLLSFSGFGVW